MSKQHKYSGPPLPGFDTTPATPAGTGSEEGYTGRKLGDYVWFPKPKTDLREYRELLKLCLQVEERDGSFSDRSAGKYMVEQGAIFDGRLSAEEYKAKYQDKSIGLQSYVSNARMTMRICRWLGWMTRVPFQEAAYQLTAHGRTLTQFDGDWPARKGGVYELDLVLNAFAELKFYSVNDVPRYQNKSKRQRLVLNTLRVLARYGPCSNYELALTAHCIDDERDLGEWALCDKIISGLRNETLTFRSAFALRDWDVDDNSTVTGVYDGPKVVLSFLRQLLLVQAANTSDLGLKQGYDRLCKGSGHIKHVGTVAVLTPQGKTLVGQESKRECVWYDELGRDGSNEANQGRAAVLLALEYAPGASLSIAHVRSVLPFGSSDLAAMKSAGVPISEVDGDVRLTGPVVFDRYRDVPPETRDAIQGFVDRLGVAPDPVVFRDEAEYFVQLDLDKARAEPLATAKLAGSPLPTVNLPSAAPGAAVPFPVACIHCSDAPCMVYRDRRDAAGAQDRFARRVCPDDLVRKTGDGHIVIDVDPCTGCMLCISRCPIGAIEYRDGKAHKLEYDSIADGDIVAPTYLPLPKKQALTDLQLGTLHRRYDYTSGRDICEVLDAFEAQITIPDKPWRKEQFYVWVRNLYRAFGLDARYTGSGGMKTPTDVTVDAPYKVANEVKSPAEGPIGPGAVRQAVEASSFTGSQYMAAVGVTISGEAPSRAEGYRSTHAIKVPLLRARYLFYLFVKHVTLPQQPHDLELLFSCSGVFGQAELHAYMESYFRRREDALQALANGSASPEMLDAVAGVLAHLEGAVAYDGPGAADAVGRELVIRDLQAALRALARLSVETHAEIERCFPVASSVPRKGKRSSRA